MPAVAGSPTTARRRAVELYGGVGKHGVNPILGCEIYVTADPRAEEGERAHLTLVAEDNTGSSDLISGVV